MTDERKLPKEGSTLTRLVFRLAACAVVWVVDGVLSALGLCVVCGDLPQRCRFLDPDARCPHNRRWDPCGKATGGRR